MALTLHLYTHNTSTEGIKKVKVEYTPYGFLSSGSKTYDMTDTSTVIGQGTGHTLENIAQNFITLSCTSIDSDYQFVGWHCTITTNGNYAEYSEVTYNESLRLDLSNYSFNGMIEAWPEAEYVGDSGGDDGGGDEGGEEETYSWIVTSKLLSTISSENTYTIDSLEPYTLYRFNFTCTNGGIAKFYSTGDVDTCAYLSTTNDSTDGVPDDIIIENDQSEYDDEDGDNFGFTYEVKAGQRYYLWVRIHDDSLEKDSGEVVVHIIPPEASTGCYIYTGSKWVHATPYIYTSSGWNQHLPHVFE